MRLKFLTYVHNNNNNNNNKKRCKNNKSPNFVWGLNNNKKRCKNNKSPNFIWGLNKKQNKHNIPAGTQRCFNVAFRLNFGHDVEQR